MAGGRSWRGPPARFEAVTTPPRSSRRAKPSATTPSSRRFGTTSSTPSRGTRCRRTTAHAWRGVEYHTALCLLLELDRRFSPFCWTNIADPELPFVGLVEHTNLVDRRRYAGRRFLYVANYVEPESELLGLDANELLARYAPGLRKVNPEFDPSWVKARWRFCEPAGQPAW